MKNLGLGGKKTKRAQSTFPETDEVFWGKDGGSGGFPPFSNLTEGGRGNLGGGARGWVRGGAPGGQRPTPGEERREGLARAVYRGAGRGGGFGGFFPKPPKKGVFLKPLFLLKIIRNTLF